MKDYSDQQHSVLQAVPVSVDYISNLHILQAILGERNSFIAQFGNNCEISCHICVLNNWVGYCVWVIHSVPPKHLLHVQHSGGHDRLVPGPHQFSSAWGGSRSDCWLAIQCSAGVSEAWKIKWV